MEWQYAIEIDSNNNKYFVRGDFIMVLSPTKLFGYALAFRFSSGRGRCFSPGGKALLAWYGHRIRLFVLDRSAAKWWLHWLE